MNWIFEIDGYLFLQSNRQNEKLRQQLEEKEKIEETIKEDSEVCK